MTSPVLAEVAEPKFHIPCEWEDYPCSKDAVVMSKGCEDPHPYAICFEHLMQLWKWFEESKPAKCFCGRPFMHFSTHFDVWTI